MSEFIWMASFFMYLGSVIFAADAAANLAKKNVGRTTDAFILSVLAFIAASLMSLSGVVP